MQSNFYAKKLIKFFRTTRSPHSENHLIFEESLVELKLLFSNCGLRIRQILSRTAKVKLFELELCLLCTVCILVKAMA